MKTEDPMKGVSRYALNSRMSAVLKTFPEAEVGEDNDGQLVIYTNCRMADPCPGPLCRGCWDETIRYEPLGWKPRKQYSRHTPDIGKLRIAVFHTADVRDAGLCLAYPELYWLLTGWYPFERRDTWGTTPSVVVGKWNVVVKQYTGRG